MRRPEAAELNTGGADAGERLARRSAEILERWEARVRQELPSAAGQNRLVLRDHLPVFLDGLARQLSGRAPESDGSFASACGEEHGEQRAQATDYSLEDVIFEYQILRETIFTCLEVEGPLSSADRDVVLSTIDRATCEAVSRYVDAQRQAQRQSEEQYRAILDGVRDYGIMTLDREGCITTWNPGAQRMTGYPAEEVLGHYFAVLFTPADAESGGPERELAIASAQGWAENERWHARRDGGRYWASGVTRALHDEDGNLRGFSKVMRDMTDRRRLEEELEQRAAELAAADRHKDQFLAMLGHELRNPLGAITYALHILDEVGSPDLRAVRQRAVMGRQVGHLSRLVEDLLDLSRIARGKLELRKEIVDLATIAANAVQTARPLIDARQHQIEIELPEGDADDRLCLDADAARIEQVLTNLLHNAAKYTEPGGRIRLTVAREGAEAVIRVSDTGVGLEPDMLERVFDLFTQVEDSTERSRGGLGVGLTLVRQIVEMHGGRVTARSAGPDRGSEFIVRLPACRRRSGLRTTAADRGKALVC